MHSIFHLMCSEKDIPVAFAPFICNHHSAFWFSFFLDYVTATQHSVLFSINKGENCLSLKTAQAALSQSFSLFFVHLTFEMFRCTDRSVFPKHQANVMAHNFTLGNFVQSMTFCYLHNLFILEGDLDFMSASLLFTAHIRSKNLLNITHIRLFSLPSLRRCLQPVNFGNQYTGLLQPRPSTTNKCCS